METIIGKGTIFLFVLFACSTVNPVRVDSERVVKKEQRRKRIEQTTRDNLLHTAELQVGVREATGHNDGKMVEKYLRATGLGKGYPWCAAFQAYIHDRAEVPAPHSARVVDWFRGSTVWRQEFGKMPFAAKRGMVGGLYFRRLGRLGHIFLIVGEDKNNYYTIEGNTNIAGSREGDGVYRKIRSKKSVAALADYCLVGQMFIDRYDWYLQKVLK